MNLRIVAPNYDEEWKKLRDDELKKAEDCATNAYNKLCKKFIKRKHDLEECQEFLSFIRNLQNCNSFNDTLRYSEKLDEAFDCTYRAFSFDFCHFFTVWDNLRKIYALSQLNILGYEKWYESGIKIIYEDKNGFVSNELIFCNTKESTKVEDGSLCYIDGNLVFVKKYQPES